MFDECKSVPRLLLVLGIAGIFASSTALAASGMPRYAGNAAPGSSVVPGTLNYIEGSVTLNGQPVTSESVGKAKLGENQVLSTAQGKAEILLTPGVYLRIGDNSSVRMLLPDLTDTRVALLNGGATVEVTELFKENHLQVGVAGTMTTLVKPGLYEFNADHPQVSVYKGEAFVLSGDRQVKVKEGHQAQLTGAVLVAKFDRKAVQDPLYAWSNLRSEYNAQASAESAQAVYGGWGPYWYGPGWYWNPYWDMYGFLPGYGVMYSPFGWPFFSPGFAYYAPIYFHGPLRAGAVSAGARPFARVPSAGVAHGFAGPRGFAAVPRMGGGFRGGARMGGGFGGGHR